MIYDCFSFFNEHTILDIRLNTLYDSVDKFIIVEATRSHQNHPKPLYYAENASRYAKFADKIIHVVVDSFPSHDYWSFEQHQRDQIVNALNSVALPDDIVFISDADEIWNPAVFKSIELEHQKIYQWPSYICYHYFNLVAQMDLWYQPLVCTYGTIDFYCNEQKRALSYDVLRNRGGAMDPNSYVKFENLSGWHFSYTEDVEYKLQNFLHSEYRNMSYDQFLLAIRQGINPFHSNKMALIDDLENYLPQYVLNNKQKFQQYLLA